MNVQKIYLWCGHVMMANSVITGCLWYVSGKGFFVLAGGLFAGMGIYWIREGVRRD